MEFVCNKGKKIEIAVNGKIYLRHAIKTKFIRQGENYIDVIKEYVSPIYKEGDIISISEKIISLCQNRIIKREDIKVGFWAKFLSKFAKHPKYEGIGVGESIKMQYAINKCGLTKVLFASVCSFITKLIGIKGIFYKIVGLEVSGLDGFYGDVWKEYEDIGIEIPTDSNGVCNDIKQNLKIDCMIVDANDFGQEILGKSSNIEMNNDELKLLIRDNPAGQERELTPLVLIRRKSMNKI